MKRSQIMGAYVLQDLLEGLTARIREVANSVPAGEFDSTVDALDHCSFVLMVAARELGRELTLDVDSELVTQELREDGIELVTDYEE